VRAVGAALLLLCLAVPAGAADWGTIVPGTSTMETVRARYGAATRTLAEKLEGYDTAQWVFEGAAAPPGVQRLTLDFGLLTPEGYRRDVVRAVRLEPKPGIFDRANVIGGWGLPARAGDHPGGEVFVYQEGLIVYFDKAGRATLLVFTPPQPPAAAPPAKR
jgi:hypothetical protein